MIEKYGTVEMELWSKDHWSMFAYVECRCVDYKGVLNCKHIRCNEAYHTICSEKTYVQGKWHDKHSTRIKGDEQIRGHDDWDCIEDLQTAGFIRIVRMADLQVEMTDVGWEVSKHLRKHKADGGVFSNFRVRIQVDLESLTV